MTNSTPRPATVEELDYIRRNWIIDLTKGTVQNKRGKVIGSLRPDGYLVVCVNGRTVYTHHVIWWAGTGEWPKYQIDHEDQIKDNNAFTNLREANHSLQMLNRELRHGRYGRGAQPTKDCHVQKFESRIRLNNKPYVIKRHSSAAEAVEMYNRARSLLLSGRKFASIDELRQACNTQGH